jgi:hypothetical protein
MADPRHPATDLRVHDHACWFYDSVEQQIATAIAFIHEGLTRGERCIYIGVHHTPDEFRALMESAGVDAAAHASRGALQLLTKEETYLKGGPFSIERMAAQIDAAIEQARADGFSTLRTCADMSWALDGTVSADDIRHYEMVCDQRSCSSRLVAICLYDRRIISPELFQCTLTTHPLVGTSEGVQRNPFYDLPET